MPRPKKFLFGADVLGTARAFAPAAPTKRADPWYKLVAKTQDETDEKTAELVIYQEIGSWGVSACDLIRELKECEADVITLRLNSPGGSAFDGIAIYNALAQHPARIVGYVDGWAASSASVLLMACDEIHVAESAQIMIHRPWSFVMGGADELRHEATILDSINEGLIDIYQSRSGKDRAQIEQWVRDETWFRGQEAVDAGFADSVIPNKKKAAEPASVADAEFFATIFPRLPADIKQALSARSHARACPVRLVSVPTVAMTAPDPVPADPAPEPEPQTPADPDPARSDAALAGGDMITCPKCDAKMKQDGDGEQTCPKCGAKFMPDGEMSAVQPELPAAQPEAVAAAPAPEDSALDRAVRELDEQVTARAVDVLAEGRAGSKDEALTVARDEILLARRAAAAPIAPPVAVPTAQGESPMHPQLLEELIRQHTRNAMNKARGRLPE